MDTRPKICVSWMPDVIIMCQGHSTQIMCIMDTGHKYCLLIVSWMLQINIVYHIVTKYNLASWMPHTNIMYHERYQT